MHADDDGAHQDAGGGIGVRDVEELEKFGRHLLGEGRSGGARRRRHRGGRWTTFLRVGDFLRKRALIVDGPRTVAGVVVGQGAPAANVACPQCGRGAISAVGVRVAIGCLSRGSRDQRNGEGTTHHVAKRQNGRALSRRDFSVLA